MRYYKQKNKDNIINNRQNDENISEKIRNIRKTYEECHPLHEQTKPVLLPPFGLRLCVSANIFPKWTNQKLSFISLIGSSL